MSTVGKETTGSSFKLEVPPENGQQYQIDMNRIATATPSFQERNGDEDTQFDNLSKDAEWVTNMEKFFDVPIWREVLGKLKKKVDIENCSNASLFFGDLLQEKREREVVLPKVFLVLGKRYFTDDKSFVETKVESIPWQMPANRNGPHRMTGFWKYRLVCKKWNKAIEEIYRNEDAGHFRMVNENYLNENYQLRKWATDEFRKVSQVVKFCDHFDSTHYDSVRHKNGLKKCPFFGRSIKVNVRLKKVESNPGYFNRLKEMLSTFGGEVWYFNICYIASRSGDDQVFLYQNTKEIVERMPNLKVLRIDNFAFLSSSNEELQALEEEIERNPFPKLSKLEMISVDEIPGTFCNHLVNQNRQISKLQVLEVELNGYCGFFMDNFPNLSKLVLQMTSIEVFEAFECHLFTLNLEKLHFQYDNALPFVSWSRVLNAVGSKLNPDTCTDLLLAMPAPQTDEERKSVLEDSLICRLVLANIQNIHVENMSGRFCLDFLLPSKSSLRNMRLFCDTTFEDDEHDKYRDKQVILFLGYEHNMQNSNIAKQFSNLKKLVLSVNKNLIDFDIDSIEVGGSDEEVEEEEHYEFEAFPEYLEYLDGNYPDFYYEYVY